MLDNQTRNYKMSTGVAVICQMPFDKLNLKKLLSPLVNSPLKPKILLLDFGKDDKKDLENKLKENNFFNNFDIEFIHVPRNRMNPGWIREIARHYLGEDIVVSLESDAYFEDKNSLEELVKPIIKGRASVSYARQIPQDDATEITAFSRYFNYPEDSNLRGIEDADRYGVYTIFCSNTCAAWKNSALDEIGGFPWVLYGEDTVAVAKLLKKGHKVAYVADSIVKHSHNYSFMEEFKRYFDTGMYRRRWREVLDVGAKDEGRGIKYAREMLRYLWKENKTLIPRAFLQLGTGWFGYKLGWYGFKVIPHSIKKRISFTDLFWFSKEFKEGLWDRPVDSSKLLYNKEVHNLHVKK